MAGNWVLVENAQVPLRCWWNTPDQDSPGSPRGFWKKQLGKKCCRLIS
ncbi:hypothetical protein [Prochlorococcus sp. MIT 1341]|nr:hypothetical protein [Prochlorococcus sp. MIT 1341]